MRSKRTKKILMFWCLFIGIGAISGGTAMLIKPDGSIMHMENLLKYFEVLPFSEYLFQDYIFPGIALIIVNGISNLSAFYLMLKNKKSGIVLGTIFGFTLILWICIQFYMFPMNFMDIIYFIFGLLQLLTGYITLIFYKQEHFEFNESDYKKITNSDTLVVYFSRMNYTKKVAYEKAKEYNAEILELTTNEMTKGTLGFWWCGRYGMHRWSMPINEKVDLSKYKKIIICSPIWVFGICAPIRDFINKNYNNLKNCDLVLVHFNRMKYNYVFENLNKKYNLNINNKISICSRKGKILYIKSLKKQLI